MSVKKHVYESGRVVWRAYVRIGSRRKRGNFNTRTEARQAEALWRRDLAARDYRHGKSPTVGEWVEVVIREHVYGRNLKDAKRTEKILTRFATEFDGVRINQITTDDLHAYLFKIKLNGYNNRPQAGSTNNRYRSWIHRLFSIAIKRGFISHNPAAGIERYPEHPRVRWLEPAEARALIDACDQVFRPLIICCICTGARCGELLALNWEDVDFDQNEIVIRASNTKSSRSRRIPMTPDLRSCLENLVREGAPEGAVFRREDGERWSQFPRHRWQKALSKSGILDSRQERLLNFRPHDLRHSTATFLLAAGVDISVVAHYLGHSSPLVTSRHYAHVSQSLKQQAADQLGRSLSDEGLIRSSVE
ncbi:tyrosine-type recombinase/integrase [Gemmatimonadota bacterium]